jgi:hypothetical protein
MDMLGETTRLVELFKVNRVLERLIFLPDRAFHRLLPLHLASFPELEDFLHRHNCALRR